jgi:hypothetical protein
MTFVLAVVGCVLAGRPPASTKGHLYWLKVVGGWYARQQRLVLAARTNRFGHSEIKMLMKYL